MPFYKIPLGLIFAPVRRSWW